MKYRICEKCKNQFPQVKVIDGKRRILRNRRFCLECSPFGTHNTRNLLEGEFGTQIINNQKYKECKSCKTLKSFDEFYSKTEWGRRYAVCSECCKTNSKKRRTEFKKWCIDYKGGKCIVCGYNTCISSLEFHHRDATKKDYIISTAWKKDKEIVKIELDKCDLVCANCHGEIHERIGY